MNPAVSAVRVAVVEDDRGLRESLRRGLAIEGFNVSAAATGGEFLDMLTRITVDVMVIDIGLPDSDGRDVALAARVGGCGAPVLFLTARSSVGDRLAGFSAGADDYVIKPFVFEELVARIRALARRASADTAEIRLGTAVLNPATMSLEHPDGSVTLTPIEFRLIATLACSEGVVRRADLMRAGWPGGSFASENTLDSYVARVRRKLANLPDVPPIRTVHRVGYQFG